MTDAASLSAAGPSANLYSLTPLSRADLPAGHPTEMIAKAYEELRRGHLLPHENEILENPRLQAALMYAEHVEPVDMQGFVDFSIVGQGEKVVRRGGNSMRDAWMSETIDAEFVEARYHEMIAASVLRQPMFSRGATPTRERAFRMQIRGLFPLFAENQARLRLIAVAAEPYVAIRD
ncbi:hypothetical protein [Neomegalonema sp.]|uniref:hypothetical protein n=1 Tax=Neomegalonema sp. TaxID=2039713 RepID=UPI0026393206|nr:hypothetical protein [Neomegalonema sp.]MDD2867994.1 hypothetical protein [Neomegalonema sp.]